MLCRLVMKRINKEFEEVMFTKAEGKMIQQLTVLQKYLDVDISMKAVFFNSLISQPHIGRGKIVPG